MMCRLNHPLAANGTMSWPHFGVQRPGGRCGRPSWSDLEPSDGRDCRLGIICWPGTRRRSYFLVFLSLLGVGDPADAEDVVRSGGATERMRPSSSQRLG
jgi:hypothetical protein